MKFGLVSRAEGTSLVGGWVGRASESTSTASRTGCGFWHRVGLGNGQPSPAHGHVVHICVRPPQSTRRCLLSQGIRMLNIWRQSIGSLHNVRPGVLHLCRFEKIDPNSNLLPIHLASPLNVVIVS